MTNYRRPSVLIVENDPSPRAMMSALAVEMGYPTVSVADGAAAWQVFQQSPPQIVIADWLMPGLDGLDLCARIREVADDQCRIMIIASRDATEELRCALAAGIDDYLITPLVPEQFRARLMIAERELAVAAARRAAEMEASRMRWLAGIGQTVLTVQHEINNPLTALYGYLEMLRSCPTLAEESMSDVTGALSQAERIASIVRQFSGEQPATADHTRVFS